MIFGAAIVEKEKKRGVSITWLSSWGDKNSSRIRHETTKVLQLAKPEKKSLKNSLKNQCRDVKLIRK